jgi:hypothetical protein
MKEIDIYIKVEQLIDKEVLDDTLIIQNSFPSRSLVVEQTPQELFKQELSI